MRVEDDWIIHDLFKSFTNPLLFYGLLITFMVSLLSFFMMVVAFGQKMRDLRWEQGVLRAMGLTQSQSKRIFYYEAICIVSAAFTTGIATGTFATFVTAGLFSQLLELPRSVEIASTELIATFFVIGGATYIAVYIPASKINR